MILKKFDIIEHEIREIKKSIWFLENPPKFVEGDKVRILSIKSVTMTETITAPSEKIYRVIRVTKSEHSLYARGDPKYYYMYELIDEDYKHVGCYDSNFLEGVKE